MNHKISILGVKISSTSTNTVLRFVQFCIHKDKKFFIVTPNPEICVMTESDKELAKVINSADISLPDGIGILAAHRFLTLSNPKNKLTRLFTLLAQGIGVAFLILFNKGWLEKNLKLVKGRKMFMDLVKLANKRSWKIYFLGDKLQSAEKAKKELEKNYKSVKIKASIGPSLNKSGEPISKAGRREEAESVKEINEFRPHILFVGFGAPKQEKWVYRHLPQLQFGGALVVGGTFDYVSGKTKLPPGWIEGRGLEWLWRLATGSQRLKRVGSATWKFPVKVFLEKMRRDE